MPETKQHDRDTLVGTVNMDLTGCDVKLFVRVAWTDEPIPLEPITVTPGPESSTVAHTFTGDLARAVYEAEITAMRGDEGPFTFPNRGFARFTIGEDIA